MNLGSLKNRAWICLLWVSIAAFGKPPGQKAKPKGEWNPTFSSEITFGNEAMKKESRGTDDLMTDANVEAITNFYDIAFKKLGKRPDVKSVDYLEGADKFGTDMLKIRYKDGWGFDVTLDTECLEVILKPFTVTEMDEKFQKRVQRDIFDLMSKIGLDARLNGGDIGGGHIHTGMRSAFGLDDVRLFRNQVVDYANHPEIGSGAFDDDPDNSPHLIRMKKSQRERLAKWVRQVDEGHFDSVRKAATVLVSDVVLEGKKHTGKNIMNGKYWGLNFLRMGYLDTWDTLDPNRSWDDYLAWSVFDEVDAVARTLEYRAVRAPKSAEELTRSIKLIHARMKFLKDLDKNIPLHPKFLEGRDPSTKEKVQMFYKWVKATGLNPVDYTYLLPSNAGERKEFKEWHQEWQKLAAADGLTIPESVKGDCGGRFRKTAAAK